MPTSYTVTRGDTLGKIAAKLYGDAAKYPLIVAANHIADPDALEVGQVLVIPDLDVAARTVQPAGPVSLSARTMQLNEERLSRVYPPLAIRGRALVELCAHAGVAVLVTQGLRTYAEQNALYAKGRTKPGKKVTNAKGGQSYHNFGLAFDVVVLDAMGKADWDDAHPGWALAGKLGKSVGLEWGGGWKRLKDKPHFQYTGSLKLGDCRKCYREGGLNAVWERVA